jgi:outer membrane protein
MNRKWYVYAALGVLLLIVPLFTAAQDDMGWIIRVRGISINPNDSSSVIAGTGTRIGVDSKVVPEVDFTFKFNKQFGMELVLATARHDLKTEGGLLGGVSAGSVRILPPTLTFQYYFQTGTAFQPYMGIGVNFTRFYSYNLSTPLRMAGVTSVEFKNSFDVAGQVGMDYNFADHWLFNLDVKYIRISTDVTPRLYTGAPLDIIKVDVDPWVFGIGFGYRF